VRAGISAIGTCRRLPIGKFQALSPHGRREPYALSRVAHVRKLANRDRVRSSERFCGHREVAPLTTAVHMSDWKQDKKHRPGAEVTSESLHASPAPLSGLSQREIDTISHPELLRLGAAAFAERPSRF
jgi:hypothetical protein